VLVLGINMSTVPMYSDKLS